MSVRKWSTRSRRSSMKWRASWESHCRATSEQPPDGDDEPWLTAESCHLCRERAWMSSTCPHNNTSSQMHRMCSRLIRDLNSSYKSVYKVCICKSLWKCVRLCLVDFIIKCEWNGIAVLFVLKTHLIYFIASLNTVLLPINVTDKPEIKP